MGRDLVIEEKGMGGIVLYQTPDGHTSLDVKLENETVWLTRQQMALLFGRDVKTIGKHINNALKEELAGEPVVAKFATPKKYGRRDGFEQIQYPEYYSLEMITSVGFRVKSKNGIVFRRWANSVLKEYLIKGYAVKNDLMQERYDELKALVDTMGRAMQYIGAGAEQDQIRSIFDVVRDYTYALDTLDGYDYQSLEIRSTSGGETFHATYENAMDVINSLKAKFGESALFGNEKDQSFRSSIGQIYQTWDGQELYPSVEEKAAVLLYLITKNHSFTDGNKRIAATLFLWFLENNGILYAEDGTKRIADNALVALTLMIAESKTEEMDMMVKVVVNLINTCNK